MQFLLPIIMYFAIIIASKSNGVVMLTREQLEKRKHGVGASDTPIIMGFSSYKTPYQLYLEKISPVTVTEEETELQHWGNLLEPVIRKEFVNKNDLIVTIPDTLYHAEKRYMLANLDGYIPAVDAVLEIKTCNAFQGNEWGTEETDQIPMQYLIQVAHQCIVADCKKAYIAVLIGGNDYRQYVYERDAELEGLIQDAVDNFWLNHVVPRIEPASITIEDSRIKYRNVIPASSRYVNSQINQQVNDLMDLRYKKKQLEKEEERAKMLIMEYMEHTECLLDGGGKPVVTLKANSRGNRVFLLK